MVVKFYISMISGNKEMKKRQMKAQLIMESKGVEFQVIDICDPNSEDERKFMQKNAASKNNARNPVPPQFFNDDQYCGDYEGFDDANENDCLEEFLKLPRGSLPQVPVINHSLSNFSSRDVSLEKEVVVVANGSEELNKVDLPDASENGTGDGEGSSEPNGVVHNEEEEEIEQEEEEEEEEEEQEMELPHEDDPMEMSTTVATAERFTEFSYKQLPGEA